jgi:hypothetical protein
MNGAPPESSGVRRGYLHGPETTDDPDAPASNPLIALCLIILSPIVLSLRILSLMAALIARHPFAFAAAHSLLLFRSNPQPAVSQPVPVHA